MATIATRATADGNPRYRVKVRLPGSRPQSRTFPSSQAARAWAEQTEAALREQHQVPQAHRHTLRDLVRRYRRHVLPTVSVGTARWRDVHLSWWDDRLGHLAIEDLTPAHLVEGRDDLAQSRSPRTTRNFGSFASVIRRPFGSAPGNCDMSGGTWLIYCAPVAASSPSSRSDSRSPGAAGGWRRMK